MEWELKIEDGLKNKIVYVQDVDADEMVGECYEGDVEDRIARARLIAAAPELLHLVKDMAFLVESVAHLKGMEKELLPMADRARAAIVKAEGKK